MHAGDRAASTRYHGRDSRNTGAAGGTWETYPYHSCGCLRANVFPEYDLAIHRKIDGNREAKICSGSTELPPLSALRYCTFNSGDSLPLQHHRPSGRLDMKAKGAALLRLVTARISQIGGRVHLQTKWRLMHQRPCLTARSRPRPASRPIFWASGCHPARALCSGVVPPRA